MASLEGEELMRRRSSFDRAATMYLVWNDLTVVMAGGGGPTRRLLTGLNGYGEPGRIMAVMGPSGSGKTTLLDALAGRLPGNVVMTGNVLVNGKKRDLHYGGVAYVTQGHVLLGTLTVRETLYYSAQLRLPSTLTKQEIDDLVDETLTEMGLLDCADRAIGNWHLRGISGGEKRRLSIALETLTKPHLLFLDEPTSGLDSASAFFVVHILRSIAREGKTVIASIHQPSGEVFALFDDLFLLSGGEAAYFGEAKSAAKFFAEAGFPCPSRRNPSDHFLRSINSDFDDITATLIESRGVHDVLNPLDPVASQTTQEIRAILVRKYMCSEYAAIARARIQEISSLNGLLLERKKGSQAKWQRQLLILTKRSFINMSRDLGYYWIRVVIYILMSLCVGTIFFDIGTNYKSIAARAACGGFISGYMTFMSIGGFQSFIEEMKVFCRERLNGHYGVAVYTISNFLSSIPFLTLMSIATSTITYFMVKFRPGVSHLAYAWLDLISAIAVVESCMMIVASLVPNFLTGLIIGAGYLGVMMITSGFFRFFPDIPKVFWRYPVTYINYGAWALEGAYKNDMIGLEFDSPSPLGMKLKGEFLLRSIGINPDHSKWWDLAAVVTILIAHRLLFFAILKVKEKAFPIFQTFYAEWTISRLKKRPSFRKMAAISSRRHQVLHSLSSQEGLNSPLN